MNFNPFPAIPRIARGQGISNLRGVYTVDSFHTNTNINLAYHVFLLVTQACKSTKIGFA